MAIPTNIKQLEKDKFVDDGEGNTAIRAVVIGGGSGDVVGPASSTDNAVARFNETTGKLLQDSPVTVSDAGTTVSVVLTATGSKVTTLSQDASNGQLSTNTGFMIVNGMTGSALRHGGTTVITATQGGSVSTIAAPTNFLLRLGSTGTTSHSLTDNDVLCGADLEVNGMLYADGGLTIPSDISQTIGTNSEVKIQFSTADADAYSMRVGLPNDLSGNNIGAVWFGSQADVIGTDIGIETGESYVIGVFQKDRVAAIGMAAIDAVATIVGVGTKAFQFFNPASGVVFSIASDDTDTLITPESGTELALAGVVKATDGVRGKHSTADVTNPPTDAELDSAFGTPSTVGAGFTATLDDNGAGTAMYLVASDGTNWWHTLMTKAT